MRDFSPPDFYSALDPEERILETPAGALAKGMYIQRVIELMQERGHDPQAKKYVAFKDYPLRDLMRYVVDASRLLYPRQTLREAICRLGRHVFPTLQASLALRVIFSFAGNNYEAALKRVADGYAYSQKPGSAKLVHIAAGEAIVELREVWNFPECYQVGVHEGALAWYERKGSVEVRPLSACDVDLRIRWS